MYGLAESGSALHAGLPFVLLHQATFSASLADHRHPWLICVHEHTFTTIIYFEPSLAGWAGRWASLVTNLSLTAEGADHLIPLMSTLKVGWVG